MKIYKIFFIFLGVFLFSMSLRVFTINQIGRTWDEPEYVEQGNEMITLLKKGDFDNNYFYTTYDHPPFVKYIYGLVAQGNDLNYDYTYPRLLSAVIFSFGVLFTVFIGWRLFSMTTGVIAGIILATLPFSLGLSQLVTAESFKIFIYPLAFYSFILLLKKQSLKNAIITGVILGVALQIKQSNGLLFPLFGLIALVYYLEIKRKKDKNIFLKKIFKLSIVIIFCSIIVFVLLWPHVLFHFPQVYEIHKSLWNVQFIPKWWMITNSVPEVFFGRLMLTPNFYYIVYFFISIPVVILFIFLFGLKKIIEKKSWIFYSLLFWFLVPFLLSFYSWRQHGLRYIIEIYPAIALISSLGFDKLVSKISKKEIKKFIFFIPVIIYLLITLWQIKPYYLDYFNELVGGTNTVYNNRWFQQGWWGQGFREAGLYLKNNAQKGSIIGLAISPDNVFPIFPQFKYSKWLKNKSYDYVVVNYYHIIRDNFDDSQIKKIYKLVYEVKMDKSTLVFIYKRK